MTMWESIKQFFMVIGERFYGDTNFPIIKTITVFGGLAICIGCMVSKKFRDKFF